MTAPYPHLVPSARKGVGRATWHGIVIRFVSSADTRGETIAWCDHEHRLARTAVACAARHPIVR